MGRNKKNQDKGDLREARRQVKLATPKLNLSRETKRGIVVIIFIVLALLSILSLARIAGSFGSIMLSAMLMAFGVMAYLVPIIFLLIAISLLKQDLQSEEDAQSAFYFRTYLGAVLLTGSIAGIIHLFFISATETAFQAASAGKGGGYLGAIFAQPSFSLFGFWAGSLVLFALMCIGILVAFNIPLTYFWAKKDESKVEAKGEKISLGLAKPAIKINAMGSAGFTPEKVVDTNKKLAAEPAEEAKPVVPEKPKAPLETKVNMPGPSLAPVEQVQIERKDWKLPSFDLLEDNKSQVDSGNIEVNVALIKKTLADFGIEVEMGEVNVGPTVTQYTLAPAPGVRLSEIAALQNNMAMALAASSIRMELPIPGKPLVGIEVPNKTKATVVLREVLQTKQFVNHGSKLAFGLGRDVAGEPIVTDLASMPHLLVAGTTGSGKSVGINTLLISLLYRNTPQDVKFIIVDPKRVELNLYNGIPHLLTPVVTDHDKAVNALKWAVSEMDRRYRLLSEVGKRNITEYNEATELRMHYIVIIIDELADLMQVAKAEVEGAIVRLAQMARAVGIHLVVATQRPSVDIITGLIKANITSRIAFAVGSQVDSRTILDTSGAEKLLGRGDMLFVTTEFNQPKRIQGAYVGEKEVKRVVDFFKQQTGAVIYNEEILEKPKKSLGVPGVEEEGGGDDDPLFEEAKDVVTRAGKASASLLQRRLRVGYARAARLLDILEEKGIIGPGDGAKPREVYGAIPPEERAEYGVEEPVEEEM